MSRALENEVASEMNSVYGLEAYRSISRVLWPPSDPTALLEIELLGKSHSPESGVHFVQDGRAVGMSKASLVQAFFIARHILHSRAASGTTDASPNDMFAATAVILLMDSEHLTAANTRKRLILAQKDEAEPDQVALIIQQERNFTDNLLTSRLHQHTKSPTLWSHRRWLVELTVSLGLSLDVKAEVGNIVVVAGERHPRNYHAWWHARWLVGLRALEAEQLRELVAAVKSWCFRNHGDVSGWSFLHHLLCLKGADMAELCRQVFDEVLQRTVTLGWTNESVWVFLRLMVVSGRTRQDQYLRFCEVGNSLRDSACRATNRKFAGASFTWCKEYRAA